MPLPDNEVKAGDRGVAVSRLAPMGKVEIGGRIYEAKSTDVYIDQRSTVEVVGFENFNVVVRKVADSRSSTRRSPRAAPCASASKSTATG